MYIEYVLMKVMMNENSNENNKKTNNDNNKRNDKKYQLILKLSKTIVKRNRRTLSLSITATEIMGAIINTII